jgi:hypothetical protein
MNEMFGEGAPAEVNYDDQYDDLNDAALDFDQFDQLGADHEEEQPDWAKSLESGEDQNSSPRRSMTIGNLEELVANMKTDPSDESGVRSRDTGRDTGRSGQASVADTGSQATPRSKQQADTDSQAKSPRKVRAGAARPPRTAGRVTVSPRHTVTTGALEAGVTGSFGQGVVTEGTRRGNPLVWIAVIVIVGALLYFGYTILTAK